MIRRVALLSLHSSPLAAAGSDLAGGMNVYVRRLGDELSRRGIRADIFTRRTDPRAPETLRTRDGTRIIHLTAGPQRPIPRSVLPLHVPALETAFGEFVQREHLQYDVLHSHYWLSGLVALRRRREADAPVLHMFHTLSRVKEFYSGAPDPADSALRCDAERMVIEHADIVAGATPDEQEYMARLYGVSPRRYAVLPPGVDLDMFRPRDKMECRDLLDIHGDYVVLFVGRLDRIKGLDLLIRALPTVQSAVPGNVKLVLVGDPRSGQRSRYVRMIRSLGLDGSVEFHPITSQARLALYYGAADVCAVPSKYESFGMVAVEAQACGTPVVAFAAGGPALTISDGNTGYLAPPGDVDAFASGLVRALLATDREALAQRARQAATAYAWPTAVDETLAIYRDAVSASTFVSHLPAGS